MGMLSDKICRTSDQRFIKSAAGSNASSTTNTRRKLGNRGPKLNLSRNNDTPFDQNGNLPFFFSIFDLNFDYKFQSVKASKQFGVSCVNKPFFDPGNKSVYPLLAKTI